MPSTAAGPSRPDRPREQRLQEQRLQEQRLQEQRLQEQRLQEQRLQGRRPPDQRRRDPRRRQRILHAAAELVAEHGYHEVGMADIGAAAGITGPAVYRHFDGKSAVLVAMFDHVIADPVP